MLQSADAPGNGSAAYALVGGRPRIDADRGQSQDGRQTQLSPVGWNAPSELSYEDWLRQGRRLGVVGRGAGWWVGDWVSYGVARYGSKYTVAARLTGYDHQTLMNMVYVATRFDISRRRENLSWSHHAELAALGQQQQEYWLDRAVCERLTVRDMRRELLVARRQAQGNLSLSVASGIAEPGRGSRVTCPRCGHTFRATCTAHQD